MIYAALFGMGKMLLEHWEPGAVLMLIAVVSAWLMRRELDQVRESNPNELGASAVEPSQAK
jgi:hypothetical protein